MCDFFPIFLRDLKREQNERQVRICGLLYNIMFNLSNLILAWDFFFDLSTELTGKV